MYVTSGQLIYGPPATTAFNPFTLIVRFPEDFGRYYRWVLKKELGIDVLRPAWGPHTTVVNPKKESLRNVRSWKKYENQKIEISYTPIFYRNDNYFWFQIESPFLESIRQELGLRPRPFIPFHITLGNRKNVRLKIK